MDKKEYLKIEKIAEFNLSLPSNVERLVLALNLCGLLTKVYSSSRDYTIIVYKF